MKQLFIVFVTILLLPIIWADIDVLTAPLSKYNLGDKLTTSFSVQTDKDIDGLFKLHIFCDNSFDLDYFVTLVNIKKNETITVAPPELKTISKMVGKCRLKAFLDTLEKENIYNIDTVEFEVSDKLDMDINIDKESYLPGEFINIEGSILGSYGSSEDYSVTVSFNKKQQFLTTESSLKAQIPLAENLKSGQYLLFIEAKDNLGNNGDTSIDITIESLPTNIGVSLDKDSLNPLDSVSITVSLLDQADELIDDQQLELKIIKDGVIFEKTVQSSETTSYKFDQFALPGEYQIIYDNLKSQADIIVNEIRKIDTKLDGENVIIKNIGNVLYEDKVTLDITGEKGVYKIEEKISLEPSESITIDLSKKLPTDIYGLDVVSNQGVETITDSTPVEDKRSLLNKITGSAIRVDQAGTPKWLSIIIIIGVLVALGIFIKKKVRIERK